MKCANPAFAGAAALLLCAGTAAAQTRVHSLVDGIRIAASQRLPAPRRPQAFGTDEFCANIRITPATPAGRHAAALGWYVTSEVTQAGYTAVGLFSRGGNATSGTCLISDGNVVLYRGARPVAIVYDAPQAQASAGRVGGVAPTLTEGRLRISDWTPPRFAQADIVLRTDAVDVVPVAAMETACSGIGLPNLRDMTLPQARNALKPHGWVPSEFTDQTDPRTAELRAQGSHELETCSGTGYGFCNAHYAHASGARLQVTTTGDEPYVANYSVTCGGH